MAETVVGKAVVKGECRYVCINSQGLLISTFIDL